MTPTPPPTNGQRGRSPTAHGECAPPPQRRKSVLFCPECSHESLADGDWIEDDDPEAGVRRLRCPACETVLTQRPLPRDSLANPPTSESLWSPATVIDAWSASLLSMLSFWLDSGRDKNRC